jgi:hypothetical protein
MPFVMDAANDEMPRHFEPVYLGMVEHSDAIYVRRIEATLEKTVDSTYRILDEAGHIWVVRRFPDRDQGMIRAWIALG